MFAAALSRRAVELHLKRRNRRTARRLLNPITVSTDVWGHTASAAASSGKWHADAWLVPT